jgi:hypothetical protein
MLLNTSYNEIFIISQRPSDGILKSLWNSTRMGGFETLYR